MANKIEEHEWHDGAVNCVRLIDATDARIGLTIGYQDTSFSKEDVMAMAEHFGLLVEGSKDD